MSLKTWSTVAALALTAGACWAQRCSVVNGSPYQPGQVLTIRGTQTNARVWHSRVVTNDSRPVLAHENPGPQRYGAPEGNRATVYTVVGHQVIALNPWEALPKEGLSHLECARQEWLREHGFVGGVRTFRSTRHAEHGLSPDRESRAVEPRAKFRVPDEMPRTSREPRLEV